MVCFWIMVVLVLAAAFIPNEKYNWISLLVDAFSKIMEKREAKKFPEFAARWKEYNAKEKELEKFYNEKIIETNRNIRRSIGVLSRLDWDDIRRGIIEETLKEYRDELLEYETLFEELKKELDAEFVELMEEKTRLGIKYLYLT